MQDLIEDLRAALDQMNRSLNEIKVNSEKTNELLEKLVSK